MRCLICLLLILLPFTAFAAEASVPDTRMQGAVVTLGDRDGFYVQFATTAGMQPGQPLLIARRGESIRINDQHVGYRETLIGMAQVSRVQNGILCIVALDVNGTDAQPRVGDVVYVLPKPERSPKLEEIVAAIKLLILNDDQVRKALLGPPGPPGTQGVAPPVEPVPEIPVEKLVKVIRDEKTLQDLLRGPAGPAGPVGPKGPPLPDGEIHDSRISAAMLADLGKLLQEFGPTILDLRSTVRKLDERVTKLEGQKPSGGRTE